MWRTGGDLTKAGFVFRAKWQAITGVEKMTKNSMNGKDSF